MPRSSGPRLLARTDSPTLIKTWSPGFVALANNHILDAGEHGLAHTVESLERSGLSTVGAGQTQEEITRPLLWETARGRLAIVNWVFPETHPDWMAVPGPNCWPGEQEAARILSALKTQVDWVLVFAHWSDELFPYPRPEDRSTARQLAEMGADLIVGHHPHVVRGMELIGACPVFYSLGNFYFPDIPDGHGGWIVKQAPRNREGLGVQFSFRRGHPIEYRFVSFWQRGHTVISDPLARAAKRLVWGSRPLEQRHGAAYRAWYAAKRARFDRWTGRWHFGVLRLGWRGTLRRLARLSVRLLQGQQAD